MHALSNSPPHTSLPVSGAVQPTKPAFPCSGSFFPVPLPPQPRDYFHLDRSHRADVSDLSPPRSTTVTPVASGNVEAEAAGWPPTVHPPSVPRPTTNVWSSALVPGTRCPRSCSRPPRRLQCSLHSTSSQWPKPAGPPEPAEPPSKPRCP